MADVLWGKTVAKDIRREIRDKLSGKGLRMAAVVVGIHGDAMTYIHQKLRWGKKLGVEVEVDTLPGDASEGEIIAEVRSLGERDDIHGIIVERPLPPGTDYARVVAAIPPEKDLDGMHPHNQGRLVYGDEALAPPTAMASVEILERNGISLEGMRCAVVNRTPVVGRPLVNLLLNRNATPTVVHTRTGNPAEILKGADVIFVAVGVPGFLRADMVSRDSIVVDVGINVVDDRVVGDADPEIYEIVKAYTPVPGGVGSLTTALLFRNLLHCATLQGVI